MDSQQIIDLINSEQPLIILQPTLTMAPQEPGSPNRTCLISAVGIAYVNLPVPADGANQMLYSICQYASHAVQQELITTGQAVNITDLTPRQGHN